jgi:hypothetical protein
MRYLLLYKKSALWYLLNQFWRFWFVLFLWLIATIFGMLAVGFVASFLLEGRLSPALARRLSDISYWSGLALSFVAFLIYFYRTTFKTRTVWVGTVAKLLGTERTGETNDFTQFTLHLHTAEGEKAFSLGMAPFSVLREGMKIEIVYDPVIGDALRIRQIR